MMYSRPYHSALRTVATRLFMFCCVLALVVVGCAQETHGASEAAPAASLHAAPEHAAEGQSAGVAAHGETGGHGEVKRAEGGGIPEPPNIITVLLHSTIGGVRIADTPAGHFLHKFEKQVFLVFYTVLLALIIFGTLKLRALMPGKLQAFLEIVVEGFYGFITGILGPGSGRFVPFLGSLWIFIFVNTLTGIIPFFTATTSVFQTTVTLAAIVFIYVQFHGIWENARGHKFGLLGGLWRWFHHLLGSPNDTIGWVMAPLMVVLHVIGELAKPLSLSLRLFGNIMGEDILLGVFMILGVMIGTAFSAEPVMGFPLHLPFFFLALLTSIIQATVFTLLSTIYLLMVLPHGEHDEHGEDDGSHEGKPQGHAPHAVADGASHA